MAKTSQSSPSHVIGSSSTKLLLGCVIYPRFASRCFPVGLSRCAARIFFASSVSLAGRVNYAGCGAIHTPLPQNLSETVTWMTVSLAARPYEGGKEQNTQGSGLSDLRFGGPLQIRAPIAGGCFDE